MDDKLSKLEEFKNIAINYLKIITNILDEIYDVFTYKYEYGEFLINIFFIILVIIITLILYWDNINNMVSSNSRCKRQLTILNNNTGSYVINALDYKNNQLFDITYDMSSKDTSITCKCNPGNVINTFHNIPVRDIRNNGDITPDKKCSCDKYYNLGPKKNNINYNGEPGIIRYMYTTSDTSFFDSMQTL